MLVPSDQYGIAGATSLVVLILLYQTDGAGELIIGTIIGATVMTLAFVRASRRTPSHRKSSETRDPFTSRDLVSLLGFVAVFAGFVLAAAGLGAIVDQALPDDDPIDLGAFVGGGLSGALLGISLGARIGRRATRRQAQG